MPTYAGHCLPYRDDGDDITAHPIAIHIFVFIFIITIINNTILLVFFTPVLTGHVIDMVVFVVMAIDELSTSYQNRYRLHHSIIIILIVIIVIITIISTSNNARFLLVYVCWLQVLPSSGTSNRGALGLRLKVLLSESPLSTRFSCEAPPHPIILRCDPPKKP